MTKVRAQEDGITTLFSTPDVVFGAENRKEVHLFWLIWGTTMTHILHRFKTWRRLAGGGGGREGRVGVNMIGVGIP